MCINIMDTFLKTITDQFSNREIATIFWIAIFLGVILWNQSIRKSISSLWKAFFQGKILIIFILLVTYTSAIVVGLESLGLWGLQSNLKDTLVWTITVAFAMIISINSVPKDKSFFRKAIIDSLKVVILLEFVIGLYPFSLPIELLLIPILVLLGGLLTITESKEVSVNIQKLLKGFLALLGLIILFQAGRGMINDFDSILNLDRLIELLLPSIFTILFLPFIFFLALFITYENVFQRLDHRNSDSGLIRYTKYRVFIRFGLNFWELERWLRKNIDLKVNDKDDVIRLVGKPKKSQDKKESNTTCSPQEYRNEAEPIMAEYKGVFVNIDISESANRSFEKSILETLQKKVDQVRCQDMYPLKHETLEYFIKHTLRALEHAQNHDFVAANQAKARAILNQKQFEDWNIDMGQ